MNNEKLSEEIKEIAGLRNLLKLHLITWLKYNIALILIIDSENFENDDCEIAKCTFWENEGNCIVGINNDVAKWIDNKVTFI